MRIALGNEVVHFDCNITEWLSWVLLHEDSSGSAGSDDSYMTNIRRFDYIEQVKREKYREKKYFIEQKCINFCSIKINYFKTKKIQFNSFEEKCLLLNVPLIF